MKILRETLEETIYHAPAVQQSGESFDGAPLEIKKKTYYTENQVAYISDDIGIHQVRNPDPSQIAVSLHCTWSGSRTRDIMMLIGLSVYSPERIGIWIQRLRQKYREMQSRSWTPVVLIKVYETHDTYDCIATHLHCIYMHNHLQINLQPKSSLERTIAIKDFRPTIADINIRPLFNTPNFNQRLEPILQITTKTALKHRIRQQTTDSDPTIRISPRIQFPRPAEQARNGCSR